MKLSEVPEGSRFLDVDSIPVVMLPDRTCIAFDPQGSAESRPYGSPAKAGVEGDDLSREEFAAWLEAGFNRFDRSGPAL
jgi:hypothetical protein